MKKIFSLIVTIMILSLPLSLSQAHPSSSEVWVEIKAPAVAKLPNGKMVGVVTYFEVKVTPGRGHVFVETWPLAQVDLQASARLATMVACKVLGLNRENYDFYFIIKANSTIIGGPSAGLTMTIAVISALTGWKINESVMATGMINPDGTVGAVGGILEKIEAAHVAGAKVFLIPYGQGNVTTYVMKVTRIGPFVQISWVPKVINVVKYAEKKYGIKVVQVRDVYQAIEYFFGKKIPREKIPKISISTDFLKGMAKSFLNYTEEMLKSAEKSLKGANLIYKYLYGLNDLYQAAQGLYIRAEDEYADHSYFSCLLDSYSSSVYSEKIILEVGALQSSNVGEFIEKELYKALNELNSSKDFIESASPNNFAGAQAYWMAEYYYMKAYLSLKSAWEDFKGGKLSSSISELSEAFQSSPMAYLWAKLSSEFYSNSTYNISSISSVAFQQIQISRLILAYISSMFGSQDISDALSLLKDSEIAYYRELYGASIIYSTMAKAKAEVYLETVGLSEKAILGRLKYSKSEAYDAICEVAKKINPILPICYYELGNSTSSQALYYLKISQDLSSLLEEIAPKSPAKSSVNETGNFSFPISTPLPSNNSSFPQENRGSQGQLIQISESQVITVVAFCVVAIIAVGLLLRRR